MDALVRLSAPAGANADFFRSLDGASFNRETRPEAWDDLRGLVEKEWPAFAEFGHRLQHALLNREASSAVVVENMPFPGMVDPISRDMAHMCLGAFIADPITHYNGNVLWDITNQEVHGQVGTISRNNDEAPFHTDGSFIESPPRFVSNLSIQMAETGGHSTLVDGFLVCENLSADGRGLDCLGVLQEEFFFLNPKHPQLREGCAAVPLLDKPFSLRFRAGVLLGGLECFEGNEKEVKRQAIEFFHQAALRTPRLQVLLAPGEALIFDNHRYLHGRTAFQGPRYLQRAWLGGL